MSPIRPLAVLLCVSFAAAGTAVAQDDGKEGETEKVEEVVEERAAEEDTDGKPADADVGEASYNTENCAPANGEGEEMAEGASDEADSDADGDAADGDADTDAAGDVEQKDMEECEKLAK